MKTSKAFAALFAILTIVSLVGSVLMAVRAHNVNTTFNRDLKTARGLANGTIDTIPPVGPDKATDLRRHADDMERNRGSMTLPYWPAVAAFLGSLAFCVSAAGLWVQQTRTSDANNGVHDSLAPRRGEAS